MRRNPATPPTKVPTSVVRHQNPSLVLGPKAMSGPLPRLITVREDMESIFVPRPFPANAGIRHYRA
ncbi:hypothetical protein GGQ65_001885 [Rhizobium fabae]|uniref:Uncharacterized protein n=1 Tax=Rhizobium fabae TaxID=573179 RepID=A0A7W6B2X1_9HYPH|nr:hypothetical protein [Rhizobium fabae]